MKKINESQQIQFHKISLIKIFRIMKISTLLLMVTFLNVFGSRTYSQNTRLTLDLKDVPIQNVLTTIEENSEFFFVFSPQMIDVNQKVEIHVTDKKISEILDELFKETDIHYLIKDRQVLLVDKNTETTVIPPQLKINGVVTDNKNNPLPGVSVVVKGTSNGTTTDLNGKFSLMVNSESRTLTFSFVGMNTQEVEIGSRSVFNIILEESSMELEEVVVIGYGTQKKSLVTGAISSVKPEDITRLAVFNPEQTLQGQVAGVVVSNYSGQPGAGISIRVRGTTTTGNAEPLYVVDGLPTGSISMLNPGDIESIEVLKDAASAAIYGARGANGVILVRTKQGKAGKTVLEFDSYYGIQNAANQIDVMGASQYFDYAKAANLYDLRYYGSVDPSLTSLLNREEQVYALVGREGTDWQKKIFSKNSPIQSYQLSLRGGNEKTVYSTTLSYFAQDGVVARDKSNYKKFTARFNSQTHFSESVSLGSNIAYTNSKSEAFSDNGASMSPLNSSLNFNPLTTVYDIEGNFSKDNLGVSEVYNPVGILSVTNGNNNNDRLLGNLYLDLTPSFVKGLTFRSSVNLDLSYSSYDGFTPIFDLGPGYSRAKSNVSKNNSSFKTYIWENTLTYERKLGQHDLSGLIGMSAQEANSSWLSGSKDAVLMDDIRFSEINSGTDFDSRRVDGTSETGSLVSYFGRLNYAYANRYMLSAIVRVDGSSNFGPNNKYATFPSFSLGWNLSNEAFMENVTFINTLKLRGGWGSNGNQSIGSFGYMALYGTTTTFVDDKPVTAYGMIRLPNPDLKWETTEQTNIGLDLGLAKDRLSFVFDYYIKKTKDLLVYIAPPALTGIPEATPYNAGNVENKGMEFQVAWKDNVGVFSYNIGANASLNRNNVTYIGNENGELWGSEFIIGGLRTTVAKAEKGKPIGYFYGYKTAGIFNDEAEIASYIKDGNLIQPEATPGDIKYVDVNDDGVISADDRTMIGSPHPDMVFGFNLGMTYKGFDLNALLQGAYGNEVISSYWSFMGGESFGNKPVSVLDCWSDNNPNSSRPRPTYNSLNRQKVSDMWVQDGSYIRFKNLQFGYTLPVSLTTKAYITKCRFYIAAQNLLTMTKYEGFDPEIGGSALDSGIDRGVYPQPRIFMFGINLHF